MSSVRPSGTPGAVESPVHIHDHELLCLIGQGSYGEVWLARNAVGTLRAVKIVHRQRFERVEHFEREFKGLQKFEPISRSHDGLVDILQIGRNDDAGYFYYIMELADDACGVSERVSEPVSGNEPGGKPISADSYVSKTLARLVRPPTHPLTGLPTHSSRLPADQCIETILALASALEHLHKNGLVHRDIKPSNIIFVNGAPKLADIGLVAAIDDARSLVGTAGYIPPEGPGTPQADLYSLGKVLYEISLGKDRQDFPQVPPDLQSHPDHAALLELNEVILKACETDFRRRYQTAEQMHDDLGLLQRGQSIKRRRSMQRRLAHARKIGLTVIIATLLGSGVWLLSSRFNDSTVQRFNAPALAEKNSIAVLPFDNNSPDQADEFLGSAVADELNTALTRIPGLRVLPRNSAVELKRTPDIAAAARRHKLGAVFSGRIRKAGNRLSITAQLVNTHDGFTLWSDTYEGEMTDLFALQTRLADFAARALGLNVSDSVRARLALKSTRNHQAHQLYLEGRFHWHMRAQASLKTALEKFQSAIALDPDYAQAYAGVADTLSIWEDVALGSSHEAMPTARAAAQKAVALNDELAEAHAALAKVLYLYDWDWQGAEREYRRAIQLDPNYPTARQGYAQCLDAMNRADEALEQIQKGVDLDPLAPIMHVNLVVRLYHMGRYPEAVKSFHRARELHPNFGNFYYGRLFEQIGQYDQAIEEWIRALRYFNRESEETVAELRAVYASSGMQGFWQNRLKQLEELSAKGQYVGNRGFAELHARLGNTERALDYLEKVLEDRSSSAVHIHREPAFAPLRSHPRFVALVQKLGLPAVHQGNSTAR